jgi:hypothetical protein
MSDDPNELVYVEHDDGDDGTIDQGAWVPRSSLRQWAGSNWFPKDPPAVELKSTQVLAKVAPDKDPNEQVVIYHPDLDQTATVPLSAVPQWSLSGWGLQGETVPPEDPQPIVRDGEFDPREVGYKEVVERLKTADDAERARIIAVEQTGQGRKSIVNWQPPTDENTEHAQGDES